MERRDAENVSVPLKKNYCALGPTLAANMIYMCIFQLNNKKYAERRTPFENGEMAVTLPTAALSGCGFGSLRCET